MATGQKIITRKTRSAIFLTLCINPGGEEVVREGLEKIGDLTSAVSSRGPEDALAVIVAIGSDAWDRLFTGPRPAMLTPFTPLEGPVHSAPATPADILVHIKADDMGLCYEVGRLLTGVLGDAVRTEEEVHGFRYFDLRDLTGFVDGTENPVGQEAIDAITVGDEDSTFAGGSYVMTQRYVTDFEAWEAISVEEQENVFGRTKLDNIEMDDDVKPANSHIALNVIEDADGNEIDIVRDNMPYGDVNGEGDKGTFYIAYSRGPEVSEEMLRNMFLGDPPGNYDRLLDFTTAVSGAQFFAPPAEFLDELPPAPTPTAAPEPESAPEPVADGDGSLRIGSLRRTD